MIAAVEVVMWKKKQAMETQIFNPDLRGSVTGVAW